MKICVYCGNNPGTDPAFMEAAAELGRQIALRDHELVFGGCKGGLMGAVADGCNAQGGTVIGIMPNIPRLVERMHPALTECVWVADLAERKTRMMEMADAFVALPGGLGTLDEISDVFALARLGQVTQPSILLDVNGFYQPLAAALQQIRDAGFMTPEEPFGLLVTGSLDEAFAHMEG